MCKLKQKLNLHIFKEIAGNLTVCSHTNQQFSGEKNSQKFRFSTMHHSKYLLCNLKSTRNAKKQ